MKNRILYLAIAFLSVMAGARILMAAEPEAPATSPSAAPALEAPKLVYKPPANSGRMPTRVSGGARGDSGVDAKLEPLIPNEMALTTEAQPSLFWYQSKPAKAKFELAIVEPKNPKPLLSLTSPDADKAGIHRVKLTRHKVELKPDVLYEWSVAIVPDPENRSKDIVTKGALKRVKATPELTDLLAKASDDATKAAVYAEAGIWYDALEAITNAIEANPNNVSLKEQRASLLKQVGLSQAAAADTKK